MNTWSWIAVLFVFFSLSSVGIAQQVNPVEDVMDKNITIRELIENGTLKTRQWYWVDESKLPLDRYLLSTFNPEIVRPNAVIIDPAEAFTATTGTVQLTGHLYEQCISQKTSKTTNVFFRKIVLIYFSEPHAMDETLEKIFQVSTYPPGTYFFKKQANEEFVEVKSYDVPFLNFFYSCKVDSSPERVIEIKKMRTVVSLYEEFNYEDICIPRSVITICSRSDSDKVEYPEYFTVKHKYNPYWLRYDLSKEEAQLYSNIPDIKITDKNHKYWMQNILHD